MAFGNDALSTPTISFTQGEADDVLKVIYSDDGITNEFFVKNPFYVLCPKKEDVTGTYFEQPIWLSAGQSQSRSFAASVGGPGLISGAGLTGEAPVVFQVPKYENMAVANISTKLVAESSSSRGSFVDMVRAIADNQLQQLVNDTAFGMFRSGVPVRGQVAGSVAGAQLTLSNVADAINFEYGMMLDFLSSGVVGATVRALGASNTSAMVTSVDYNSPVITLKWTGSGTQTLTANNVVVGDYIVRSGDAGTGSTAVALGTNGFKDWIPYGGVTSSDSFLTVNRSLNATRGAGSYLDGTGGNLEEVLERALNQVGRLGGKLTHLIMPYAQFTALANSQGSKVQLVDVKSKSGIGFSGIQITGVDGTVMCLPDRSCPSDLIAGIDIGAWKMISVGKAVHVYQDDGKVWLRSSTQNGMEIRFYSLANMVCKEPRNNINIKVNPLAV